MKEQELEGLGTQQGMVGEIWMTKKLWSETMFILEFPTLEMIEKDEAEDGLLMQNGN